MSPHYQIIRRPIIRKKSRVKETAHRGVEVRAQQDEDQGSRSNFQVKVRPSARRILSQIARRAKTKLRQDWKKA